MKPAPIPSRLALIIWLAFSIWHLSGLKAIPFHPDESTQIFMSSDLEQVFSNPSTLIYNHEKIDLRQHYRLVDAPLTRYLIGFGRWLSGQPRLPADWSWSLTWEQNKTLGALPSDNLLLVARFCTALLLPISLFIAYLTGRKLGGEVCGLIAMILLGTNTLILLHTRRAMAESGLTLGVLFVLWSFTQAREKPWLVGLALAIAVNSKQSALALLPTALLAVCLLPGTSSRRGYRMASNLGWALLLLGLVTIALNPFLWRHPISAAQAAFSERQQLVSRQVAMIRSIAPEQTLDTTAKRSLALVANLFLTPPAFEEANNYHTEIAAASSAYMAFPVNRLLRNLPGAGLAMTTSIWGLVALVLNSRHMPTEKKQFALLLVLAFISQVAFQILAVPLPWQRYVLPTIPFICLFAAYGIAQIIDLILALIKS